MTDRIDLTAPVGLSQERTTWTITTFVVAFIRSWRVRFRQRAVRQSVYVLSALGLGVGLVLALQNLPAEVELRHWQPLAFVFAIGAPAGVLVAASEFRLSAEAAGVHISWLQAIRVSILSGAAEALPGPGGAMVRVAALADNGVKLTKSGAVVAAVGVQRVALVLSYAGVCFYGLEQIWLGFAMAGVGIGALIGSVIWLRALGCRAVQVLAFATAKAVGLAVTIVRMWWLFAAFGLYLSFAEASVFVVVPAAASLAVVVPAGLGVAEAATATVAAVIALPASAGFVAAAVGRVAHLAFLFPAALIVSLTSNGGAPKLKDDQT